MTKTSSPYWDSSPRQYMPPPPEGVQREQKAVRARACVCPFRTHAPTPPGVKRSTASSSPTEGVASNAKDSSRSRGVAVNRKPPPPCPSPPVPAEEALAVVLLPLQGTTVAFACSRRRAPLRSFRCPLLGRCASSSLGDDLSKALKTVSSAAHCRRRLNPHWAHNTCQRPRVRQQQAIGV